MNARARVAFRESQLVLEAGVEGAHESMPTEAKGTQALKHNGRMDN